MFRRELVVAATGWGGRERTPWGASRAAASGLGCRGSVLAMGLQAFSRRGLSLVRALLFLGASLGRLGGVSRSLPLEETWTRENGMGSACT